jgi:hypothetical protein
VRDTRDRQYDIVIEVERLPEEPGGGGSSYLLRTFAEGTYPTTAARVYACHPVAVDCTDEEAAAATLTAGSGVIHALNVGTTIPPAGTDVIACGVGGRVVFRYDGPE